MIPFHCVSMLLLDIQDSIHNHIRIVHMDSNNESMMYDGFIMETKAGRNFLNTCVNPGLTYTSTKKSPIN